MACFEVERALPEYLEIADFDKVQPGLLGLILLLSVTGLWPYALIVIGLLLVLLFGAVVIGMTLHDEEAYLNKKFGMDEKDTDDKTPSR